MQDSPKDGMNWKLFFLSGLLLILPTWYAFYYISPVAHARQRFRPGRRRGPVDHLCPRFDGRRCSSAGSVTFSTSCSDSARARNPKADYVGVKSHASTYIEGIVAIFEAVLLIGFAIPGLVPRGG